MWNTLGSVGYWTIALALIGIALNLLIAGLAFFFEVNANLKQASPASTGGFVTMYYCFSGAIIIPICALLGLIWGFLPPAVAILESNGTGPTSIVMAMIMAIVLVPAAIFGGIGFARLSAAGSKPNQE